MIAAVLPLVAAAVAAPAYNLPSAAPMAEHAVELTAGPGVMLRAYGPLPAGRLALRADFGRFGVNTSSTVYVGQAAERFDLLGLQLRAWSGDKLVLGPALMFAHHAGESPLDRRVTARLGLALDAGGERWRFDATLGLLGGQWYPAPSVERSIAMLGGLETALASELGVRWEGEQHSVRAGLLGVMPCLRYGWTPSRWVVAATAGTLGTQHLLQLELGMRLPGSR